MSEYINHPDHYNKGDIEVIDVIEDWNLGFHLGNAIKYIARAEHKDNTKQDLEKAKWYLQRYIDNYLVEEREEYAEGEKLNI